MKKKVLLIGNTNLVIFGLRSEIIESLKKENYDVVVAFQNGPFGEGEKNAKKYNCKFVEIQIDRRGKNPLSDLNLLWQFINILRLEKPDIVLAFNVKCDIYGGIACRILNIPFIPNITGLGKGLVEDKITKNITLFLYKIALKKSKCVFFQNNDDKSFFEKNKVKYKKGVVLPGSGVNIDKFVPLPYPKDKKIKFLYIARVMKTKGIDEFLEAARKLESDNTEFQICGYCEEDYKETLEKYEREGLIKYFGLVNNINEYIEKCNCVVLPSYHPEGIANVLLEAASSARPIITTNRTGCKETVIDGKTGYLMDEKNVTSLIETMKRFLKLTTKEQEMMGIEGRKYIIKTFDRRIVVENYINEIKLNI